jgi:hypothetical protein
MKRPTLGSRCLRTSRTRSSCRHWAFHLPTPLPSARADADRIRGTGRRWQGWRVSRQESVAKPPSPFCEVPGPTAFVCAGTTPRPWSFGRVHPQLHPSLGRISQQQKEPIASRTNPQCRWAQSRSRESTWLSREQTKSMEDEAPRGTSWWPKTTHAASTSTSMRWRWQPSQPI